VEELNVTLEELRSLVLECLRNNEVTQYVVLCRSVARIAREKGLDHSIERPANSHYSSDADENLHRCDSERVLEIVWSLVVERILTIGANRDNASWPHFRITEYGKRVLSSTEPIPHDPSGYLKRLVKSVPKVDPIIQVYVEESLATFSINAILSSTIALGCASERAIILLCDSISQWIESGEEKDKFDKNTANTVIKKKFDAARAVINQHRSKLPPALADGLETMFTSVFEIIRMHRNDAGHPTGTIISREQAFANLQLFIPYLQKIYSLIDFYRRSRP
jgi:hypothetical protein